MLSSGDIMPFVHIFLTVLVLIATVSAAIAACKSFRVSQKILYYQLLSRYSSGDMGKSLGIMWELYKTREKSIEGFFKILKRYRGRCEHKFVSDKSILWKDENGRVFFAYVYDEVNEARRQISHFFQTAFDMSVKMGALDKAHFNKICCEIESFKLLYYVVEWLELAHATSWLFDRDLFTDILNNSGLSSEDILNLKNHRPPPECRTWEDVENYLKVADLSNHNHSNQSPKNNLG